MNIFVVDADPQKAAQALCDAHVVKMPTESGQMLSAAIRLHVNIVPDVFYKVTKAQAHHPCTLWVGNTRANFEWLLEHALALLDEYDSRYGKPNKYIRLRLVLANCSTLIGAIPNGALTPFPQAMPEKYRIPGSPVEAYRQYYLHDKVSFARWNRHKQPPSWWHRSN